MWTYLWIGHHFSDIQLAYGDTDYIETVSGKNGVRMDGVEGSKRQAEGSGLS